MKHEYNDTATVMVMQEQTLLASSHSITINHPSGVLI